MNEINIHERTKDLHEQCTDDVFALIQPITERYATPVNISLSRAGRSKLVQLPEGKIPFEAIMAHLTRGNADTVRLGFEIPSLEYRIGTVALRYEEGKVTAGYDEHIQQLFNRS